MCVNQTTKKKKMVFFSVHLELIFVWIFFFRQTKGMEGVWERDQMVKGVHVVCYGLSLHFVRKYGNNGYCVIKTHQNYRKKHNTKWFDEWLTKKKKPTKDRMWAKTHIILLPFCFRIGIFIPVFNFKGMYWNGGMFLGLSKCCCVTLRLITKKWKKKSSPS